jgi:hypothetical protein
MVGTIVAWLGERPFVLGVVGTAVATMVVLWLVLWLSGGPVWATDWSLVRRSDDEDRREGQN